MTTSGLPDSSSFDVLGGSLNDYTTALDSTTDLPAQADNSVRLNVSQMTRLAPRAWCRLTGSVSAPGVVAYDACWGADPLYAPTVAVQGTGRYLVTFPTSVIDGLGITRYLALRAGMCNVQAVGLSGPEGTAQAYVQSGNTVLVSTFSGSVANSLTGIGVDLVVF